MALRFVLQGLLRYDIVSSPTSKRILLEICPPGKQHVNKILV
jgi:hypothetical protein